MVNKVTFVGFRGAIAPISPLDPPLATKEARQDSKLPHQWCSVFKRRFWKSHALWLIRLTWTCHPEKLMFVTDETSSSLLKMYDFQLF